MRKDIDSFEDIQLLVDSFYTEVRRHPKLGPVFNDVIGDDWSIHLPKMYAFWESILLNGRSFKGNPMEAHRRVNSLHALTGELFETWLKLFRDTLDEHFEGPTTEKAYNRAASIAMVTQLKLSSEKNVY